MEVISSVGKVFALRGARLQAPVGRTKLGSQVKTFKVGVLQGLLWRDSLLRIEGHHLVHQIDCTLACIGYQLTQRCRHKFGKREANLGRKLVALWPLRLRRTAQHGTSFIDLVGFIIAWEKGSHQIQLCHDRSQSEYVDWTVVVGAAEENFWCSIPTRADIVCEGWTRTDFSRQAEVCDFDGLTLDQHILGLHVPMKEAMFVHIRQTKHCLEHNAFDLLLWELLSAVLHQLVDVLLHELKDKVKIVVNTNHFLKFDDLRMV